LEIPHAIAIVGNSGAGKTTLPERLIPALNLNAPEAIAEFIASSVR
jgi:molybdopterin-guanine dinucleotide biosynthesis protein